jgi:preprotein translocase subunit YajC
MRDFKVGDKVICNGNQQGMIIAQYSEDTFEVRLRDGNRIVGVVAASRGDLLIENK